MSEHAAPVEHESFEANAEPAALGGHDAGAAPPEPSTPATPATPSTSQVQAEEQQLEQSDPQLVQDLQTEDQLSQEYSQSDPQLSQDITTEEEVQLMDADPELATDLMVEAEGPGNDVEGAPPSGSPNS